jgi:hypothetical protein
LNQYTREGEFGMAIIGSTKENGTKVLQKLLPNVQLITQAYLDNSALIQLAVYSSVAVTVGFSGEYYNQATGEIGQFSERLVHTGSRARITAGVKLSNGYLMNLRVYLITGSALRGQCWAICDVMKFNGQVTETVLNGYVVVGSSLSYPLTPITEPTQGRGFMRTTNIANPGAGADFSYTFPTNMQFELQSINETFTTAVAAGNRNVQFQLYSAANNAVYSEWTENIPASSPCNISVSQYGFHPTVLTLGGVQYHLLTLPKVPINSQGAATLNSVTPNIAGADAHANINILLEDWINPA